MDRFCLFIGGAQATDVTMKATKSDHARPSKTFEDDLMSVEFLLVNFREHRVVLADGDPVGVTNHILMLPANEYDISLDGGGYVPSVRDVTLTGTSIIRPKTIGFR